MEMRPPFGYEFSPKRFPHSFAQFPRNSFDKCAVRPTITNSLHPPLACTFTIGTGRVHRVFVKSQSLPLIRINRRAFSNYCITNKIIIITAIPQLIKRFSAPNNFRLCRCFKSVPSSGCGFFASPKLTRLEMPTFSKSFNHQATALSVL